MAGEKKSTSVLFGSIAVLGIPAVIYLMGYIYWTKYFSHFGVDLAKVNLPVYKVMVGATPAVYALILAALLIWFALRQTTRTNSGYEVPVAGAVFVLGLVFLASGATLLKQSISTWIKIAIFASGGGFVILSCLKSAKRHQRVGWPIGMAAIVAVPITLFFLLEYLSETKAKAEADKLLGETCEECSFVSFHSPSDTNLHLPDSLVLIASTQSHYFVFSRTERTEGKLRVFEVNKNSVLCVEIDTPGSSSEK